jgi:hypothetical protein
MIRLLASILLLTLGSCRVHPPLGGDGPGTKPPSEQQASIPEIERWDRLTMPESAEDIRAYVDTEGLGALVVLTFKLPRGDLARGGRDSISPGRARPAAPGMP